MGFYGNRRGGGSGWDGWPARPKADKLKYQKTHPGLKPVAVETWAIADTFWGKSWCNHFEAMADFENRLPRGRSYCRSGAILHLEVGAGSVKAVVAGGDFYDVVMSVSSLPPERWQDIKDACQGSIATVIDLLKGSLSSEIMRVICDPQTGMFPLSDEISWTCSCPDHASLCKHVASVFYGIGHRLDQEPHLLFTLRGVDPADLIAGTTDSLVSVAESGGEDVLVGDLGAIFGIDVEAEAGDDALEGSLSRSFEDSDDALGAEEPGAREAGGREPRGRDAARDEAQTLDALKIEASEAGAAKTPGVLNFGIPKAGAAQTAEIKEPPSSDVFGFFTATLSEDWDNYSPEDRRRWADTAIQACKSHFQQVMAAARAIWPGLKHAENPAEAFTLELMKIFDAHFRWGLAINLSDFIAPPDNEPEPDPAYLFGLLPKIMKFQVKESMRSVSEAFPSASWGSYPEVWEAIEAQFLKDVEAAYLNMMTELGWPEGEGAPQAQARRTRKKADSPEPRKTLRPKTRKATEAQASNASETQDPDARNAQELEAYEARSRAAREAFEAQRLKAAERRAAKAKAKTQERQKAKAGSEAGAEIAEGEAMASPNASRDMAKENAAPIEPPLDEAKARKLEKARSQAKAAEMREAKKLEAKELRAQKAAEFAALRKVKTQEIQAKGLERAAAVVEATGLGSGGDDMAAGAEERRLGSERGVAYGGAEKRRLGSERGMAYAGADEKRFGSVEKRALGKVEKSSLWNPKDKTLGAMEKKSLDGVPEMVFEGVEAVFPVSSEGGIQELRPIKPKAKPMEEPPEMIPGSAEARFLETLKKLDSKSSQTNLGGPELSEPGVPAKLSDPAGDSGKRSELATLANISEPGFPAKLSDPAGDSGQDAAPGIIKNSLEAEAARAKKAKPSRVVDQDNVAAQLARAIREAQELREAQAAAEALALETRKLQEADKAREAGAERLAQHDAIGSRGALPRPWLNRQSALESPAPSEAPKPSAKIESTPLGWSSLSPVSQELDVPSHALPRPWLPRQSASETMAAPERPKPLSRAELKPLSQEPNEPKEALPKPWLNRQSALERPAAPEARIPEFKAPEASASSKSRLGGQSFSESHIAPEARKPEAKAPEVSASPKLRLDPEMDPDVSEPVEYQFPEVKVIDAPVKRKRAKEQSPPKRESEWSVGAIVKRRPKAPKPEQQSSEPGAEPGPEPGA